MSRLLRLFLLVSLGLNVGLGWTLLRERHRDEPRRPSEARAWRSRPAPGDSAAWRRVMDHRIERLADRLDLEPAQVELLQQLQAANGPLVHRERERAEAAREEVRAIVNAGDFEPGRARDALRRARVAQAGLDSLVQEFLMQELALMNPQQRARYVEILPLDPWRGPRPGGSGHDGDPGPGPRRGGGRRHPVE